MRQWDRLFADAYWDSLFTNSRWDDLLADEKKYALAQTHPLVARATKHLQAWGVTEILDLGCGASRHPRVSCLE